MSDTQLQNLLIELETKVAHQELTLETLNEIVTAQQTQITELQLKFEVVIRRLKDLGSADADVRVGHEKPPHY